ncbi:MAG: hypothetical protein KME23_18000 [Goleter apudmare HA4340-LM2]|jgi:hypothetical protein|nr:hypothetical protein [Goleter apudmare HA4340-LM2]
MTKMKQLFKTLGLSWLAFLITGVLISWFFAIPTITVLIDRSYCPPTEWQQVVQNYAQIYQQHQQRRLHLQSVILFSSLGEEQLSIPPLPEVLQKSSTYGRSQQQRQLQLQKAYPQAQLLQCVQ